MIVVVFIVGFIISCVIVNGAYSILMRILGANIMFFNAKTKICAIILLTVFVSGAIANLFQIT